ncbi:MAG: TonB-dependent receptor [Terriglobia bacterium]
MIKRIAFFLLLLAFVPLPLYAQQTGASITGHIIDPSAAAVSGAAIHLTSTTTGAVYTAGSSNAGVYQLPFVPIGTYTMTVEKQGFKKYEQQGIALLADEKAVVDVTMQLGATTQSVTVTANAPVLQMESGDRTTTISITSLDPENFRGLNTITTTWMIPGVTDTGGNRKVRPWDNAGVQDENINGGQSGQGGNLQTGQQSGNQVMVNGVSTNQSGNGTGFSPIASTVEQVTVQNTMYDAQFGWSTGGHIDTITKGGTNQWHGHGYDYLQNSWLNAEDWTSIAGAPGVKGGTGRLPWHFNYFGGEVGGPLRKDKIFVYYAFQQIWQVQRDFYTNTVPTAAERQGNFNGLMSGSAQVQLYDPSTTTATCASSASTPCRTQSGSLMSGNIIPTTNINPIAAKVMSILPLPAFAGSTQSCPAGVTSAQAGGLCGTFQGNILTGPNSRKFIDFFPEHTGRIDWNFTDKTHAYFMFSKNDLAETRSYIYSTVSAINPAETSGNNPLFRGNQFYVLELSHTFSPTTVLEFRTGMDRYPSGGGDSTVAGTDAASLGFSPTFESEVGHLFPQMTISQMGGASGQLPSYTAADVWNHELVIAHTHGAHNLKFGFQRFDFANYVESPGYNNGTFTFNGYYTDQNPTGATGPTGYGLADFELGLFAQNSTSTYTYINEPAYPEYWMHEDSLFIQDDYHLSRKLTLNMGLRWDYSGPVHDKHNRLLNGFCFTCQNPIGFIPGLGNLLGGPTYAGAAGAPSGTYNRKWDNFGPRLGFAYDLGHDTLLRGGWGVIYAQQFLNVGAAPGFTQTTTDVPVPGAAGIFNPALSFANPFPSGLVPIVGAQYGLASNIGKGITFVDPNVDIPRTQQYSLEFQHQFGQNWMVSLAYVGSHSTRLNVNQNLNYLPLADLPYTPSFQNNTTAPFTPSASCTSGGGSCTYSYLTTTIANPFLNNLPAAYSSLATGTYLASAKVAPSQLLLPYPQFSGVTEDWVPIGRSHYNSMQFEVSKRMSMGLEFRASFTYSKCLQALGFLNAQDLAPAQTYCQYDVPREVKVNFAYFAPFGPGRRFLNHTNGVVSRLVSGWDISATPMIQDGPPAPTPSGVMPIKGAAETTANRTLTHWFNTCYLGLDGVTKHDCAGGTNSWQVDSTPAWQQLQPDQLYEWSPYMHGVRYVGFHRLDASIKKETFIKERYQITLRADAINAFNSSEWYNEMDTGSTDANFGMVGPPANTPGDDPRVIMVSLQLKF